MFFFLAFNFHFLARITRDRLRICMHYRVCLPSIDDFDRMSAVCASVVFERDDGALEIGLVALNWNSGSILQTTSYFDLRRRRRRNFLFI